MTMPSPPIDNLGVGKRQCRVLQSIAQSIIWVGKRHCRVLQWALPCPLLLGFNNPEVLLLPSGEI